ncbi:MAG: restriction endonuclease [Rubrivivax sp.]|nr:restriction endonuclease [Rubrivivax sp.]
MTLPTYDRFIEPLLRFLVQHRDGVAARLAYEAAADALGLTEGDRLKRAGLSSSPRRGWWMATPQGVAFASDHPAPFTDELVETLAAGHAGLRLKPLSGTPARPIGQVAPAPGAAGAIESPDDRLEHALDQLRQAAQAELLELLAAVSPTFFETIVLDLLHRMGYGASRADLQRVGGSGDGGIDGVISLDRLGLEKVYVQAKRWQDSVGRPSLQAFYGALAGKKAKKGVFITTSSYTPQATEFARSVEGIVLVDGERLTALMIEHEVGVTARTVKVPKIDGDYFDDGSA